MLVAVQLVAIMFPAVAENQLTNKNRMHKELSDFAARLCGIILSEGRVPRGPDLKIENGCSCNSPLREFDTLALELFALQFKSNSAYRKICEARGSTPEAVEHWTQIPTVPTAAFKELELTCLPPGECTAVFHSSGTTGQKPSRHFHSAESLAVYEASLWSWFAQNVLRSADGSSAWSENAIASASSRGQAVRAPFHAICLTPPPAQAPHSSLVHMFETVRRKLGTPDTAFVGRIAADGSWTLDFEVALSALNSSLVTRHSSLLLGTAFSFVHLLDYLDEKNLRFDLPPGTRVMETGGYKNRSRTMPKTELHALIAERLGIPPENIVSEYGMSELSSQAYDRTADNTLLPHPGPLPEERENDRQSAGVMAVTEDFQERPLLFPLPGGEGQGEGKCAVKPHCFHFPPWTRAQIMSPETGREVVDGETGLICVFDLANVFSVMAIQTEDVGVRHGEGFALIGRARLAEPRGCSLMMA